MTEFFRNLSMQALSKTDDSILLSFNAIEELPPNINMLLKYKIDYLNEEKMKKGIEIDKILNKNNIDIEKTTCKFTEEDIINSTEKKIKKIDFPTDASHLTKLQTAKEIENKTKEKEIKYLETQFNWKFD